MHSDGLLSIFSPRAKLSFYYMLFRRHHQFVLHVICLYLELKIYFSMVDSVTTSIFGAVAGNNAIVCNINNPFQSPHKQQLEKMTKDLFLTFHCYCARKDVGFGALPLKAYSMTTLQEMLY